MQITKIKIALKVVLLFVAVIALYQICFFANELFSNDFYNYIFYPEKSLLITQVSALSFRDNLYQDLSDL
ncbi:MAG: hypothetical protein OHK0057_23750 [Thermoflexibacter sp.]